MNDTLLSVLELAEDIIPPELIDEDGFAGLAAVAGMLPFALSTFWGFECRLGENNPKMDVLFEIRKSSPGRYLLAGNQKSSLDEMCMKWPAWQHLRRFAVLWADSGHAFSDSIHNIWLEFDTAELSDISQVNRVLQQPCIFFGPDVRSLEKTQSAQLIKSALMALGETNPGETEISSFVEILPGEAFVFQVGIMLARTNPGLRLCVYRLDPDDVAPWLAELNWKGDTEKLGKLLKTLSPMLNTFAIDLSLMADGPADKIGLECYMDWLDNDPEQWDPFFRFLEDNSLCIPSKLQGIVDFEGATRVPDDWQKRSDGIVYTKLYRKIHHIKLSIVGSSITEAKAYLAMNHPGIDVQAMNSRNAGNAWLVE